MSVFFGSQNISEIYKGNTAISEIYHGNTLVWSAKQTFDAVRFDYTGAVQTWVVPKGIKKIAVDCVGAMGSQTTSRSTPGFGGRVQCTINVISGSVLYIYVGQAGAISGASNAFNGGGKGAHVNNASIGANGGGASDIRIGGTALTDRKIVAGGGGGAYSANTSLKGGNGGGLIGAAGGSIGSVSGGGGGTQNDGGAAGTGNFGGGTKGSLGQGGDGKYDQGYYFGNGGGGGYYGGGSSGVNFSSAVQEGGGGGGSSYTDASLCSDVVHTQGYNSSGNGWIIISPTD
ncbi:MAG: glycine rich domain-containing protein [Clostridium sp.]|nr:glycine rich domain-containing protein [Clostridium sp.]